MTIQAGSGSSVALVDDKGNGTFVPIVGGGTAQAIPDFRTAEDLLAAYGSFAGLQGDDFVTRKSTSNGQSITALVGSPLTVGTDSRVVLDVSVIQPCALEIEASMIRARHQFATMTLYADDEAGPDVVPSPINIVTIYQSNADFGAAYSAVAGTILTIVLETALPAIGQSGAVYLSDWVHVDGLVDNRLNYPNLCIKFISADRKTITCGFSDELALPSIAATYSPALGSAKCYFYNNMGGAHDGGGFRFTGTTATSAALVSIFGGGDVQVSGTLVGDHRVTVASSDRVVVAGATTGNGEIKATSRYRVEARPNDFAFMGKAVDSNVHWSHYATRSAVKPALQRPLRPRFRLVTAPSATRPVDKIVSVSKSGTTTWTVNHTGAYPFVTGQYVTLKSIRDQANFPSFSTPAQITVVSPTQFTLVSTTGTATSYGGSVILANGGVDQPGIVGQAVQSASIDSATGWLTLIGSANWTTVSFGDYVVLHGNRVDGSGVDLGIDGCWEVANVSTNALTLMPVFSITGTRVSPAISTLASTNCGGAVIVCVTLRAHDMILEAYNEARVTVDGAGTARLDKAIPVRLLANDAGATNQNVAVTGNPAIVGQAAEDAAATTSPVIVGGVARTASTPTTIVAGDAVRDTHALSGAKVVRQYAVPETTWNYTGVLTTTTPVAAQAAAGPGLKRFPLAVQAGNGGAAAVDLIILDGTTERWRIPLPVGTPYDTRFPVELVVTANTALNLNLSAANTGVRVNLQGYTAP